MAATGQAGGEGQAQGEGQGQGQSQGGADVSQLAEQLGGLGQSMEEMREYLASNPWAAQQMQEEGGGDPNELDLSWLDQEVDPQAAATRLNEVINGAVDQRAQALVAPLREQQTAMRRDQEARDLAGEFPELADPEMAQKVAGRGGLAEQAANMLGQPALAAEPSFWRLAYMAHKSAEQANNEGSGDPGAAILESGNGAGPGPSEADLIKQIVESGGRGSSVLDFG